jgi:hypothetical protein
MFPGEKKRIKQCVAVFAAASLLKKEGKQMHICIYSSAHSSRRCSASLRNSLVSCFCPLRYTTHDRLFTFDFFSLVSSTLALWKQVKANNKRIEEAVQVCYV